MSHTGSFIVRPAVVILALSVAQGCASGRPELPPEERGIESSGRQMEDLFAGKFPGVNVHRSSGGGISITIRTGTE